MTFLHLRASTDTFFYSLEEYNLKGYETTVIFHDGLSS